MRQLQPPAHHLSCVGLLGERTQVEVRTGSVDHTQGSFGVDSWGGKEAGSDRGGRSRPSGSDGRAEPSLSPHPQLVLAGHATDEGGGPWARQTLKVALPAAGNEPPTLEEGPRRSTQHTRHSLKRPRGHLLPFVSSIPSGPGTRSKGQSGAEGGRRRRARLHGPMEVALVHVTLKVSLDGEGTVAHTDRRWSLSWPAGAHVGGGLAEPHL